MALQPTCRTAGFFVLRTPSLSADSLATSPLLATDFGQYASNDDPLVDNRSEFRKVIRDLVSRGEVRNAIALASPDLASQIPSWLGGTLRAKSAKSVERSLVKYLSRMCSRSTPFGLFAGIATGVWGDSTTLSLGPNSDDRKVIRLDWGILESIVCKLEQDPIVRSWISYRPNTSIYQSGGWYRYLERRNPTGKCASFHLEAIKATSHLDLALLKAKGGARWEELVDALTSGTAVGTEEAKAFLNKIIDAQVLCSDLHPPLSNADPLGYLINALHGIPIGGALTEQLEALGRELRRFENEPMSSHSKWCEGLQSVLTPIGVPSDSGNIIQVDLYKPSEGLTLSSAIGDELAKGAETLRRLTPIPRIGPIDRFRSAFSERYGDRWMPILEILDEESGIGFDGASPLESTLLDGISFHRTSQSKAPSRRDLFLLSQSHRWQGRLIWELNEEDLAGLENPNPHPFSHSFSALVSLSASNQDAMDRGEFRFFMDQFSGATAARWLGRFAGGDSFLKDSLIEHLKQEEAANPEAIFAEIIHSPEGRMGNVIARPVLRTYEIPYLTNSGVPDNQAILPIDLMVTVRGDRVFLASRRLGKEVIPRLSNAHNFMRGPIVYRFLAHLQDQDGRPGGWSWGSLTDVPFLPRVTYGRHVISKARWRIEAGELKDTLSELNGQPWNAFQSLRERRGLPRLVMLVEGDNHLLVDLDQVNRVESLHHIVSNRSAFNLVECFPDPSQFVVNSPEGRFAHELVIPFEAVAPSMMKVAPLHQIPNVTEVRTFPPGSEWLYLKVYCGPASGDRLLVELAPLLRQTQAEGLWDRWHFIRYQDPDHHIRLRFHGRPKRLLTELIPTINKHLEGALTSGRVWKMQLDTFDQELERYGGVFGFELAASWFQADSENVIKNIVANTNPGNRWKIGLTEIDGIWAAMGFGLLERRAIALSARKSFRMEFGGNDVLSPQVGHKIREIRRELEINTPAASTPKRAKGYANLIRFREASEQGLLQEKLTTIASSLAHMHLNRLLHSNQREQEWILMEFLVRFYDSALSRKSASPDLAL